MAAELGLLILRAGLVLGALFLAWCFLYFVRGLVVEGWRTRQDQHAADVLAAAVMRGQQDGQMSTERRETGTWSAVDVVTAADLNTFIRGGGQQARGSTASPPPPVIQ